MKAAGNFSELIKVVGEKSKKPTEASFLLFMWLGYKDSNLGWRNQNPLPYRLAIPQ